MPLEKYCPRTRTSKSKHSRASSIDTSHLEAAATTSVTTETTKRSLRLSTKQKGRKHNKENLQANNSNNDNEDVPTVSDHGHLIVCPICRIQFSDAVGIENRKIHVSKCGGLSNKLEVRFNQPEATSCNEISKHAYTTVAFPSTSSNADNIAEKKTKLVEKSVENEIAGTSSSTAIDVGIIGGVEKNNGTCPVCNKAFPQNSNENEKLLHTNKCLDDSIRGGDVTISEQEKSDELLARSLQEELQNSSNNEHTALLNVLPDNVEICQFCKKDITRLTLQQRQVHVNVCMDKIENIEGKNIRQLPTRKARKEQKQKSTKPKKTSSKKAPKKQCPICKSEQFETVARYFSFQINFFF